MRPNGYRLVRSFGRGVNVRRRKASGESSLLLGWGLIAIGIAGCILAFLTNVTIAGGQPVVLMLAGGQVMVIGVGLVCYSRLMERTSANEQALNFQYDIGYEAGYQEHKRQLRPTVVDLQARRALSSAGGVVDRG